MAKPSRCSAKVTPAGHVGDASRGTPDDCHCPEQPRGDTLLEQDRPSEAEPLLRESLSIRMTSQPEEWMMFINKCILGGVLVRQNKLAEAEPLLLDGYKVLKAREGELSPDGKRRMAEAAEQIAKLYEQWSWLKLARDTT